MPGPRLIPFALLAAALAVGGCGGGGGGDLSGDPETPSGYKTYEGAGVSFAYPGDWEVSESTDPDGAPFVQILPGDRSKTPYGLVQLSVTPDAADRFESLADQRRVVLKTAGGGTIDSDESVDVPGADKALRATATTPPGKGSDPVEVQADTLDVLRPNGEMLVLTAAAPQRDDVPLDPSAVVSSFRLDGS